MTLTFWEFIFFASRRGGALVAIGATLAAGAIVAGGIYQPDLPVIGGGGGSCATSTQYVPDGPDNQGGCFPGPSNTGPNAPIGTMTTYTGSCSISTTTTIDSKVVNCSPMSVSGGSTVLTIQNSYLNGGVIEASGSPSIIVRDSLLDNAVSYPACSGPTTCSAGLYACGDPNNATTDCGITGSKLTVQRTEVTNTNRAAYCYAPGPCLIEDNYFHGTNLWPDDSNLAHASSYRNEQNVTLRHNTLWCSYQGPFPNSDIGCSADMSGYPDFAPITNDLIDGNLFVANTVGNAFCAYGGSTTSKPFSSDPTNGTNIRFTDNVFQKGIGGHPGPCGDFGAVADFNDAGAGNVFTGNIYDDGTTVPTP